MALLASGTNATTSLNALQFEGALSAANIALVAEGILDDQIATHPIFPGAFSQKGQLYIPNRGWLQIIPGDWVMFDTTTGWPILLSQRAVASGPWAAPA